MWRLCLNAFCTTVALIISLLISQGELLAMEPITTAPDADPPVQAAQTNRIIVKYRQNAPALKSSESLVASVQVLSQKAGVPMQFLRTMSGNAHVLVLDKPRSEQEVRQIANRIAQEPDVEYAEPDSVMRIQQANDPRFNEQWHYHQAGVGINVIPAWQSATGANVVVGVIDTGFRPHADLAGQILSGYDFISDVATSNDGDGRDADASDPGDASEAGDACPPRSSSWHGTHVAGTIAAATNNGLGVAGVARDARILPVRVLGKCGGFIADIVDGMRWAAGMSVEGVTDTPNPARVLNLSLGGSGPCGRTFAQAIADILKKNVSVIVAAGNSNKDASNFQPANCDGVVTVAATNRQGARAFYSNFGKTVEIAAPGGETSTNPSDGVLSTLNSGASTPGADTYAFYQGTSMATPHVTGVVALLYGVNPAFRPSEVLAVLQHSAQPFPTAGTRPCNPDVCGAGIIDAAAAVNEVFQQASRRSE